MKKLLPLLLILALFFLVELPFQDEVMKQERQILEKPLSFWSFFDSKEVFETLDPSVSFEFKQFGDATEMRAILLSQLKKDKGPDIFAFSLDDLEFFLPYLLPSSVTSDDHYWNFIEDRLIQKKSLLGIPLSADALMTFYHKRYYQKGIERTWPLFSDQTRNISIAGVSMGRLDNIERGSDILSALKLQTEGAQNFFERFTDEKDKYFNWSLVLTKNFADKEFDSFLQEKVAAIFGYGSDHERLLQKVASGKTKIKKENIGVALFPQFDEKTPKYLGKAIVLGVSRRTASPKEAWELIRRLTNESSARSYEKLTGKVSGREILKKEGDLELQRIQKQELLKALL